MSEALSLSLTSTIKSAEDKSIRISKITQASATFSESISWSDTIVGQASDIDVTPSRLDDIDFIIIETNKPITVKLNGTGNFAIPVQPILTEGAYTKGILALCTQDLTSIHISVPGTEDASVNILLGYIA